jgi:hypothetical protein
MHWWSNEWTFKPFGLACIPKTYENIESFTFSHNTLVLLITLSTFAFQALNATTLFNITHIKNPAFFLLCFLCHLFVQCNLKLWGEHTSHPLFFNGGRFDSCGSITCMNTFIAFKGVHGCYLKDTIHSLTRHLLSCKLNTSPHLAFNLVTIVMYAISFSMGVPNISFVSSMEANLPLYETQTFVIICHLTNDKVNAPLLENHLCHGCLTLFH